MPQPAETGRRLNEAHKQKLLDGGICEEILIEAGVFSVTSPEEVRRLTGVRVHEGGGIAFPYPGETDFVRVRLDVPQPDPQREGKTMKYISPIGAGCRLYVPPRVNLEAETIIITEGEKKALAAVSRGLNCFGVAGIDAWRERGLLGEKLPPVEALLPRLKRDWSGQKIVLVYDSDIDQRHDRWEAFPTLAEVLYSLGADEVKVVTLPKSEDLKDLPKELKKKFEKIGLDDFFVAVEEAGGNAVEEFWKIVNRQSIWVPIMFSEAAVKFAEKVFQTCSMNNPTDIDKILSAAASIYITKGQTVLQGLLKSHGFKSRDSQLIQNDAKRKAEVIKENQKERSKHEAEEAKDKKSKTITEAFPPAAEVLPPNFPFPDAGKGKFYAVRNGKIVIVSVYVDEETKREKEIEDAVCDAPVFLTRRVVPVEQDAGIEKWRIVWWERNGVRREADVPAAWAFDVKKVAELINVGIPVSSATASDVVDWLHRLRCLAVLGHDGAPPLPMVHAVSRCGWHELNKERFFVLGREILRPEATATAEAGDRDEIQQDAGAQTDADIRWAEDLSAMERQILNSIRCNGDPEKHKKFLTEVIVKYPQIAFGLGCAAGAPLLRYAHESGLLPDVAGFSVFMVPYAAGRSRHQGKSTWNAVLASFYGYPGIGAEGRLRHADSTRVARGVLLSASCDLTVHLEELQHLVQPSHSRQANAKAGREIESLIHTVADGMDRERGARGGGGRKTRSFHVVLFGTAEIDVTTMLSTEAGAHERVLKLPPLLPEESDANREESDRLVQTARQHYGHAGREYLSWLVKRINAEGNGFILQDMKEAVKELNRNLPADTARRASAGRMTTRAAVGLVGLNLLLESWGAAESVVDAAIDNFFQAWEMVINAIPVETVAECALNAVQSYIATNKEMIEGLRDPEAKGPPPRWVGTVAEVIDDAGQRVHVIALTETAFAEAVEREPYNLDPHHALQALAAAGYVVTRSRKNPDGRVVTRMKIQVRLAGMRVYCICVKAGDLCDNIPEAIEPNF